MKSALALSLTVLVFNALGCNVYDSTLVDEGLAGVPERPSQSTSSTEDSVEAVFALRNVSLDQSGDRWRRLGLDLDGMRTTSIQDAAECVSANGNPPLDGDKGIDNAFGQHVLPTLVSLIACLEDNIALNQGLGFGTVLVRLKEWNGTRNDAKVDISIISAVDGTSLDDVSGLQWGGANGATLMEQGGAVEAPPPDWDGEDFFFADPASLVAGDLDRPNVWKTDAYVSKGRMVLPVGTDATFAFLTGPGSFSISVDGYFIGDISEDGQTFTKGLLAGRFSAGQLLATFRPLGICDESLRESVEGLLTDNLDLRVDQNLGSPDDPCTASGVSFAFQAIRANLATMVAPVALPVPDPCADGDTSGVQPAFDRCCRSVELNTPDLLPEDCSSVDLVPYMTLPNPIPVPPADEF